MGRRKVRRGDYIVLGPTDGLVASRRDRTAAVLRGLRQAQARLRAADVYRGEGVDAQPPSELRDALLAAARRSRDRARRRRPAALRLPDRGRVVTAPAVPQRAAATPERRIDPRPAARQRPARAAGAWPASLRRLGIDTVRDLLFHLPRRYDDFSQPMTLRELREQPPEGPVSADGRGRRPARRAGLPAARPAHGRAAARRDRRRRGDLVRPALHRAAAGSRADRRAVGQGRAARLAAAFPEP